MSIRLRSLGIRVIPKKPDYDCSRAHFEHFLLRHPERLSDVIPNVSEESTAWMLHFAYAPFSMTGDVIPNAVRNPVHGCFTSLSMTKTGNLHAVQHDKTNRIIPSASLMLFRALARNPPHGCFARHDKPRDTLFFGMSLVSFAFFRNFCKALHKFNRKVTFTLLPDFLRHCMEFADEPFGRKEYNNQDECWRQIS